MPTIEVETSAVLKFASLFENGIEKASADFSGLLLEAANYIEYLQSTGNEALKRKAELERQLAETRQYLAVTEGEADGGPPGWTMEEHSDSKLNIWCRNRMRGDLFGAMVGRDAPSGPWVWRVWHLGVAGLPLKSGSEVRVRNAMAAAEAAYQEVIKGG